MWGMDGYCVWVCVYGWMCVMYRWMLWVGECGVWVDVWRMAVCVVLDVVCMCLCCIEICSIWEFVQLGVWCKRFLPCTGYCL